MVRRSDGQETGIEINYFNNNNFILNISAGLLKSGEETITNRMFDPYSDYLRGPFPSGKIEKTYYIATNLIYWFKQNYSISSSLHWAQDIRAIDLKLSIPIFQSFAE